MPPREPSKLNLDALIVRQDMARGKQQGVPRDFVFNHENLERESGWVYLVLRKPDFQRSTSSWTPEKVRDMVVAYLEGDTVPAVIVWRSPKNDLFIIDGAHRVSSIIAWINNDYGDGKISKDHYGEPQNPIAADKARKLIDEAVGSYDALKEARTNRRADPKHKKNAKKLGFARLPVQELLKATAPPAAEQAFIKINEQGVAISETEKWLIQARFCPNAIAARAVSLKGTGGDFWQRFNAGKRKDISKLAAKIHSLLFSPALNTGELKTVDLPIAGPESNSLPLIFQFINFANDVPTKPPASRGDAEKLIPVDPDGSATIRFLQRAKRVATIMSNLGDTNYSRSLDLHPFVYFYSRQGNHMPTMFLATAYWLHGLDNLGTLPELAVNGKRGRVEDFLLANGFLIDSISRKVRGEEKAVRQLAKYLAYLFENIGASPSELLTMVGRKFKVATVPDPDDDAPLFGSKIPIKVKNAIFIDRELEGADVCEVCQARIPERGLSSDHRIKREHLGSGSRPNVGPTHHACNSAKDKITSDLDEED